MSAISRRLPNTIPSRSKALNTPNHLKTTVPAKDVPISSSTSDRLDIDTNTYNKGTQALTAAEQAARKANAFAEKQADLLRVNVGCFYSTFSNGVRLNLFSRQDKAYYNWNISVDKQPNVASNSNLMLVAEAIIVGDAKRVANGGIAMAFPTIKEFAAVYDSVKSAFDTAATCKIALNDAQKVVNDLNPIVDKTILKVWNEIEAFFSDLEDSAKRSVARTWGITYISTGSPAVVSGKILNSVTGAPVANVEVHIDGVNKKVKTDVNGAFTINTKLNGDLLLIAQLAGYNDYSLSFHLDDGGAMAFDVRLVPIV